MKITLSGSFRDEITRHNEYAVLSTPFFWRGTHGFDTEGEDFIEDCVCPLISLLCSK